MHMRWRAITLGFGLAMLLQGNAAAGVMLLQGKIGYAAGLPPFSVAALPSLSQLQLRIFFAAETHTA